MSSSRHIDVKYLPPLGRRRSYAYSLPREGWGRHRPRHPLCPSRNPRRSPGRQRFPRPFLARFLLEVHTILTDNGSEFTDRFTVDKKAKPKDRPSGDHAFDRVYAARAIAHRLTQPFRPQTNGMVERFNRRLGEHIARMPQNRAAHHRRFLSHAETRCLPPHLRRRLQSHPF